MKLILFEYLHINIVKTELIHNGNPHMLKNKNWLIIVILIFFFSCDNDKKKQIGSDSTCVITPTNMPFKPSGNLEKYILSEINKSKYFQLDTSKFKKYSLKNRFVIVEVIKDSINNLNIYRGKRFNEEDNSCHEDDFLILQNKLNKTFIPFNDLNRVYNSSYYLYPPPKQTFIDSLTNFNYAISKYLDQNKLKSSIHLFTLIFEEGFNFYDLNNEDKSEKLKYSKLSSKNDLETLSKIFEMRNLKIYSTQNTFWVINLKNNMVLLLNSNNVSCINM